MEKNLKSILENATGIEVSNTKRGGGSGTVSLSVTNNINGKRVSLSTELYNILGQPEQLQFAIDSSSKMLIVGKELPMTKKSYKVSFGNHATIYKAALVESITDTLELDFSDKTSSTNHKIEIDDSGDSPIAFVQF